MDEFRWVRMCKTSNEVMKEQKETRSSMKISDHVQVCVEAKAEAENYNTTNSAGDSSVWRMVQTNCHHHGCIIVSLSG